MMPVAAIARQARSLDAKGAQLYGFLLSGASVLATKASGCGCETFIQPPGQCGFRAGAGGGFWPTCVGRATGRRRVAVPAVRSGSRGRVLNRYRAVLARAHADESGAG